MSDNKVKADISSYYFDIDLDAPRDLVEGVVGLVRNHSNPNILIRIVLDDEYTTQHYHQSCTVFQTRENYLHECRIYLSRMFYDALKVKAYLYSAIWHEIGHFHTLPFISDDDEKDRLYYYYRGLVDPKEVAADLFSLLYEPKDNILEAFRFLIRERNKKDDGNIQFALGELRSRRDIIRAVEEDDEGIIQRIEALYER